MKVRAYQTAEGEPVRLVIPNEALRRPGESDTAFLARICALTEAHDPTLRGVPHADVDPAELPAERVVEDEGGKLRNMRAIWTLKDGAVAVDRTKEAPELVAERAPRVQK